ncbi:MAG: hypothetical protein K1X53_11580 [Candidatus Sumerlaeaceae bacterium]|nr:hypothetical protein [Candidatus Sumerlaeaceae bacterium]
MRKFAVVTSLLAITAGAGYVSSQPPTAADAPKTEAPKAEASKPAESPKPVHDGSHKGPTKAPETTQVDGRIMFAEGIPAEGGVAYFVFQSRLMELSHADPMGSVRDMAEAVTAVDGGGSFSLEMAPGNYAMIYDPKAASSPEALQPGPMSMTKARKMTDEQLQARADAIKENAAKGLPIQDGAVGDAFIVENRIVRPPITGFGEMVLSQDNSVTILAVKEDGKPIDFPARLKMRGKNGDIYEAHTPSVTAPGYYVFNDVFPQYYQVIAFAVRPKPGAGDVATTPTLKNTDVVFEGKPVEKKVTVIPSIPGKK